MTLCLKPFYLYIFHGLFRGVNFIVRLECNWGKGFWQKYPLAVIVNQSSHDFNFFFTRKTDQNTVSRYLTLNSGKRIVFDMNFRRLSFRRIWTWLSTIIYCSGNVPGSHRLRICVRFGCVVSRLLREKRSDCLADRELLDSWSAGSLHHYTSQAKASGQRIQEGRRCATNDYMGYT